MDSRLSTFSMLKFDKFKKIRFEHDSNIDFTFLTLSV